MTYSEILARLETATGPDRVIDWMVFEAAHPGAADTEYAPLYTTSLDAVVALIESKLPGWGWINSRAHRGNPVAWAQLVHPESRAHDKEAKAKTPTLALLTAAIRALADKEAE